MRRTENELPEPEIVAALDAIDATLAGEPVDPRYAELAELALLVAAQRPEIEPAYARALDERVAKRLETEPKRRQSKVRVWTLSSAAAAVAVGVVALVVALPSGGGSPGPERVLTAAGAPATSSAARPGARVAKVPGAPVRILPATPPVSTSASGTSAASVPPGVLQPPQQGRQIVQSSQLSLATSPIRMDVVAQEVYNVVGAHDGIVSNSTVTATGGPGGYAQFQLSVPSAALAQTMAQLSQLRYASVVSRTDTTQDVTDQISQVNRRLGNAQALRTSLLKQLANATSQQQIDSLQAQLHDADSTIASAESQLRNLNHQVSYSQVMVTIQGGATPIVPTRGGGGFTISKAAHDAGRVLTVVAGVALIVLAALVPLTLVVALSLWIAAVLRRRRREQALDLA
jgi:uncharacterized protein DUF4349